MTNHKDTELKRTQPRPNWTPKRTGRDALLLFTALTAGFTDGRPLQNAQPASKKAAAPAPRANPAAVKKLRIEVGHLEEKVSKLEAKQNELTAELEAPETYASPGRAQHLNRELSAVVDELTMATAAWEKAAAELLELEKAP